MQPIYGIFDNATLQSKRVFVAYLNTVLLGAVP